VAKPAAALALVLGLGYPPRMAVSAAVSLAQIGEFSFILAGLARELHLLPEDGAQVLVAVSILSISLNPLLYRQVGTVERLAMARPRLWSWLNRHASRGGAHALPALSPAKHRAVVVGYGPVGRTVARLLRESDIEPVIIEMNLDTVRVLRAQGMAALYGDARHADILLAAGIDQAVGLVLSASGMEGSGEVIRQACLLNPGIRVVARTAYLRQAAALQRAGAHAVFSGEGEVALTLTEFILRELGATPEQIERERQRIREELFEASSPADPPPSSPSHPLA
jgi:monovalent cation:H+ antiporter-2, CPA2 family